MKNKSQYEKILINSEIKFSFNHITKNFLIKVEGKTILDQLYLYLNERGSGRHGVNIHDTFVGIKRINKVLSFEKIDFEKNFDLKDYDK